MAKRRRSSAVRSITRTVVQRAPAPVIRLQVPKQQAIRRVGRRVGHHAKRGAQAAWGERAMLVPVAASWALGHLEKTGDLQKIPRVLGLGPVGSAGVIAYVASKWFWKTPMARGIATGLLCVAANAHGRTGQISGDVMGGYPGGNVVW